MRIGDLAARAVHAARVDVYRWCLSLGIPVGTHLAESANEHEWLQHGAGPLEQIGPLLVPPTGQRSVATLEPVLGPDLLCAHCVDVDAGGDRPARRARRPRRPLPALERAARLRGRAARRARAPPACGSGSAPTRPASTPSFDVFEEMRTAIYLARAAAGARTRLDAADGAAARDPRRGTGARDSTTRSVPWRPESEPTWRWCRCREPLPSGGGSGGGGRLRRLAGTSADDGRRRRNPIHQRGRDDVARGTQHRKRRPSADARAASAVSAPAQAQAAAVAGGAVLPAAPQPREVGLRRCSRSRSSLGFVLLGVGSGSTGIGDALPERLQLRHASGGASISSLQKKVGQEPEATPRRGASSRPRTSRSSARRRRRRRSSTSPRSSRRTGTRSRARVAVHGARDDLRRTTTRRPSRRRSRRRPRRRSCRRRRRRSVGPPAIRGRSETRSRPRSRRAHGKRIRPRTRSCRPPRAKAEDAYKKLAALSPDRRDARRSSSARPRRTPATRRLRSPPTGSS